LGLLSAAVPLKATATAVLLAVLSDDGNSRVVIDPSPWEVDNARSVHVMGFTSQDDLLIAESEGKFTVAEWEGVVSTARNACCQQPEQSGLDDAAMGESPRPTDMRRFIRSSMEARVASDLHWK